MKTIKNINTANLISNPKLRKILKTISILMVAIPFISMVCLGCYLIFTVNPIVAILLFSFIIGSFMFSYILDKEL